MNTDKRPFFRGQSDRNEALEFNGKSLPLEYLKARLSHNRATRRAYFAKKRLQMRSKVLRMDSDYYFSKPDVFTKRK